MTEQVEYKEIKRMKETVSGIIVLLVLIPVLFLSVSAASPELSVTASAATLKRESSLTLTVSIEDCPEFKSMALVFSYDRDVFETVSGDWNPSGSKLSDFDAETGAAAIAFDQEKTVDGALFTLVLKVKNTAKIEQTVIKITPTIKNGTTLTDCAGAEKIITIKCDHVFGAWTKSNQTYHARVCTLCNTAESKAHTWNAGTVTKAATCKEEGSKTFTCTVCKAEKTETLAKLSTHTWDTGKVTKAATCTEKGVQTFTCTVCNITGNEKELPALGHSLISHEANAATCTEKGNLTYNTCLRCDYTTYSETPALGHNLIVHEAQAATMTENGWEAYNTCSRCNYSTYVEIPALSHKPIHHEAKAATCTEIGWNAYDTCSECDYSGYREIPALGHNHIVTGSANGIITYVCSRCGDSYTVNAASVKLSNTAFTTAWNINFTTSITGKQLVGSGGNFTLIYDPQIVTFVSAKASSGVAFTHSGNQIIVTVNGKITDNAKLLDVTFKTSDELDSGDYAFLSVAGTNNQSDFKKLTIYKIGDVNLDGNVNSRDATMIKQYSVKMVTLTEAQKVYADAYPDGSVNSRDSTIITQYIVKMPVKLGDRVQVKFDGGTFTSTVTRSVHSGKTLTTVPTPPDGYRWSASKTAYQAPVYTSIKADKVFYLIRKENV